MFRLSAGSSFAWIFTWSYGRHKSVLECHDVQIFLLYSHISLYYCVMRALMVELSLLSLLEDVSYVKQQASVFSWVTFILASCLFIKYVAYVIFHAILQSPDAFVYLMLKIFLSFITSLMFWQDLCRIIFQSRYLDLVLCFPFDFHHPAGWCDLFHVGFFLYYCGSFCLITCILCCLNVVQFAIFLTVTGASSKKCLQGLILIHFIEIQGVQVFLPMFFNISICDWTYLIKIIFWTQ